MVTFYDVTTTCNLPISYIAVISFDKIGILTFDIIIIYNMILICDTTAT